MATTLFIQGRFIINLFRLSRAKEETVCDFACGYLTTGGLHLGYVELMLFDRPASKLLMRAIGIDDTLVIMMFYKLGSV